MNALPPLQRPSHSETLEVLELYVYSTEFTAAVQTGVDYRGKSSANLRVAGSFGGVEAQHCGDDVIRSRRNGVSETGAAKFALENRLEETCNVLSVMLHTAPLDVNFIPSMVPKLLEMLQPPETAEPSAVAAPGDLPVEPVSPTSPVSPVSRAVPGLEAAVHALLGKEGDVAQYADAAFDRAPDQVNLDVMLAAPRIHIPVKDWDHIVMWN
ncbi:Vacuolar protein sorting-associated protein 13a [Durusdinium trenchii]|uniref:Vacuolar protein sorting-associated protein 13a n=1 Tax=Durusdinium trenchii TaxID=1381693 RepID=A0ABP0SM47_9DINO